MRALLAAAFCALCGCSSGADQEHLDRIIERLDAIERKQNELGNANEDIATELAEIKDLVEGIDALVENIDCGH